MQEAETSLDLAHQGWEIGIIGNILDDRGQAAVQFLTQHTDRLINIKYDSNDFSVNIDNEHYNADNIDEFWKSLDGKTLVLEATTLGFVELFLCCQASYNLNFPELDFLYIEPKSYRLRQILPKKTRLLHKRDFELSGEVPGYKAIPGATQMLSDRVPQKCIFFLGYEERRLDRALEDYQMIQPSMCSVVFGVPAFKPGWEMDAFANNIRVIKERNIRGGVHFCGAENPASALEILEQIYSEMDTKEKLFIAPLSTKPSGIAVAIFTSTKSNVGILYDHPQRRPQRSSEVAKWHLFSVDFLI